MLNHNMKDLGVFVSIFAEAGYLEHAQEYLNELQERLNTMRGMKKESTAAEVVRRVAEEPNEPTAEPLLEYERVAESTTAAKLELGARGQQILQKWEADGRESREPQVVEPDNRMTKEEVTENDNYVAPELQVEPEPGIIRDEDGKVTHVSVQAGNLGYDPEIHENTVLKIYCDGKHIENAHTADTVAGLVLYYKKNEQGRIKTLELHGEVEIRGLEQ